MAPYMGEANQKNIVIASKLMELMHFINNKKHMDSLEAMGFENANYGHTQNSFDNRNMLIAARPYIDHDKRDMVDLLITVMDISEILKKIERMNASAY